MIKIQLTDKRRLTSDENQYCLQKLVGTQLDKKTGERVEKWESYGYYVSVRSALMNFGNHLLRQSNATTLPELLTDIEKIDKKLHEWDKFRFSDWEEQS